MSNSIHSSAIVDAGAELGDNIEIGPYAIIGPNVRVGSGTRIMSHVVLDGHTTIGEGCVVFPFASIGTQTQDLKYKGGVTFVEIGAGTTLREYVTVNSGTNEGETTVVGARCLLMACSHVAHTCRIGDEVIIANCGLLAGDVVVESQAIIGGLCGVHQFVRIGRMCMVGGASKITQDCAPFTLVDGNPATVRGLNSVGLKRRGVGPESRNALKQAYAILFRQGLAVPAALARIESEVPACPEVEHLVSFMKDSERGITR